MSKKSEPKREKQSKKAKKQLEKRFKKELERKFEEKLMKKLKKKLKKQYAESQSMGAKEELLRARWNLSPEFVGRVPDADKMYTFLKGFFTGASMPQALKALGDVKIAHAGQTRRGGLPYIVHPLSMACATVEFWQGPGDKILDDAFFAAELLHDVKEDTHFSLEGAGYSKEVCHIVGCLSLSRYDDETKFEMKRRKMNGLLECLKAALIKGFDRDYNLSTMVGVFEDDQIRKNVVETDMLLLPVLRKAKKQWPEAENLFSAIKRSIRGKMDDLAIIYGVRLTEGNFVNAKDAQDYSRLLIDAV